MTALHDKPSKPSRHFTHALAAGLLASGVSFIPLQASAEVHVCTFPGSPSTALDQAVAREVFKTANVPATFVTHGIDEGDDDGVSLKELGRTLGHDCDVVAGFPRSSVADASGGKMLFSRAYLRSGYVSVEAPDAKPDGAAKTTVAAMYASPAQLIAVQQTGVSFDLENTSEQTVNAVASGHAQRAIVWYPAVVAFGLAHPQQRFTVAPTTSPYADWHLVFAFGPNGKALQKRVDAALATMSANGKLADLTRSWALPDAQATLIGPDVHATRNAYRDGPETPSLVHDIVMRTADNNTGHGGFIKVSTDAATDAPSFDRLQADHGKTLYASSCAKCHGGALQGVTAPALRGPAFAPAQNAHLTIGGIFGYMSTNMPADRPGKLKDQDYADIMAFLLYSNGYQPGSGKLTADGARSSATKLTAGPAH
ncbi:c-type cytochrome [Paraburkholderia sp. DHOC27]|uniref:c-type cytochrome n=1 Tax=Paraburkholderia sp. DHOC27 TaxID=2303330 RepID=UPI000E3CC830|nr:c-type cytochrome [Paraburkholderia sp. DHOC27]RFU49293.1 cytochrome C [Paraburkholderia sp. DHOC27]